MALHEGTANAWASVCLYVSVCIFRTLHSIPMLTRCALFQSLVRAPKSGKRFMRVAVSDEASTKYVCLSRTRPLSRRLSAPMRTLMCPNCGGKRGREIPEMRHAHNGQGPNAHRPPLHTMARRSCGGRGARSLRAMPIRTHTAHGLGHNMWRRTSGLELTLKKREETAAWSTATAMAPPSRWVIPKHLANKPGTWFGHTNLPRPPKTRTTGHWRSSEPRSRRLGESASRVPEARKAACAGPLRHDAEPRLLCLHAGHPSGRHARRYTSHATAAR